MNENRNALVFHLRLIERMFSRGNDLEIQTGAWQVFGLELSLSPFEDRVQ